MKLEIKSPAKINLYLKILNKRNDGYHDIETAFQYINLYDLLIFRKSKNQISISSDNPIFEDDDNTVIQAIKKMQQYLTNSYGVNVQVEKKIPMGSGLGGASSNAASTIVALNKLWNLNLSQEKLLSIGKEIGADVPFFIFGKNALGKGIGEVLKDSESIKSNVLIIDPRIHNSSKEMFSLYDLWKVNNNDIDDYSQNSFWSIFLKKNKLFRNLQWL